MDRVGTFTSMTLVDVNVCLDAADGLCLHIHNAQANWRASTALRSVDGDAEIIRAAQRKKGENKSFQVRTRIAKHMEKF